MRPPFPTVFSICCSVEGALFLLKKAMYSSVIFKGFQDYSYIDIYPVLFSKHARPLYGVQHIPCIWSTLNTLYILAIKIHKTYLGAFFFISSHLLWFFIKKISKYTESVQDGESFYVEGVRKCIIYYEIIKISGLWIFYLLIGCAGFLFQQRHK